MLALGKHVRPVNLGTRLGFGDIAATVLSLLGVQGGVQGESFAQEII